MRRYHRWLAVVFGVFILYIATTGLLSQFAALYADGGFKQNEATRTQAKAVAAIGHAIIPQAQAHEEDEPTAFKCPDTMTCRPKAPPTGARAWVGFFHKIHSGEQYGPAGVILSILSGCALLFFAFSGLWMYVRMFRARSKRERAEHPVFWK